jgi:hypothetical protein
MIAGSCINTIIKAKVLLAVHKAVAMVFDERFNGQCVRSLAGNTNHRRRASTVLEEILMCDSDFLRSTALPLFHLDLTILRRDRFEAAGSCSTREVMLPHPVDISNAGHRKPLFLDRSWQPGHIRHLRSRWRMIKDYCRWLLRKTKEYD